jgi:hypothetical protein
MVTPPKKYYNKQQLEEGIRYEMQFGVDRATATRVAMAKMLNVGATYYRRQAMLTPVIRHDTVKIKRKMRNRFKNESYNPFNAGSLF